MAERFVRITAPDLPDLDAALSWVVQTVDKEGLPLPNITIQAYHPLGGEPYYSATVSGDDDPHSSDDTKGTP